MRLRVEWIPSRSGKRSELPRRQGTPREDEIKSRSKARILLRLVSFLGVRWRLGGSIRFRVASQSGSTRAAQNLNSGILPNGSSAGFVSRLAAASAKQKG